MPNECVALSQLRERYLGLMKRFIDHTGRLLKATPPERGALQAEQLRLFSEFWEAQEAVAKHRRKHPVHGQILEDTIFVLVELVVAFCRDGAMVKTHEALIERIPDKELARGLLFSSERWLDYVSELAKLIERIDGQHSDGTSSELAVD